MKTAPWDTPAWQRRQQRLKAQQAAQQAFLGVPPATVEPVVTQPVEPARRYEGYGRPDWLLAALDRYAQPKEPEMAKARNNGIWEDKYPAAVYRMSGPDFKRTELMCCGVKELHGLQSNTVFEGDLSAEKDGSGWKMVAEPTTPEDFISFAKASQIYWGRERPYYIFTEAGRGKTFKAERGHAVVAYIEEHGLGNVAIHGPLKNENSGNYVTMFVWMVDNDALRNHKIVKPEKVAKAKAA